MSEATEKSAAAFEPKIVALVCKWCTYAGADLAGTSRMTYPANVRAVMLPCTGRIDISFVLRAFLQGADGVIVSGCHPGDCHYTAGNFRARRRWRLLRDLLDALGFDLRRFELAWISAAEGAKWVKTITGFTEKIRELGPYELMHKLSADHAPAIAPAVASRRDMRVTFQTPEVRAADPKLIEAVAQSLQSGQTKAVVGWTANRTLSRPRPCWVTTPEAAQDLIAPVEWANLARFLKNPQLKSAGPIGIIARTSEVLALSVLMQEAAIDPALLVIFAVDEKGQFVGLMSMQEAMGLLSTDLKKLPEDQPVGFTPETYALLDKLMAGAPEDRWAFWSDQFSKCIKCYACRGSCPMCTCEQCFADRNLPQWFPTASDAGGNLSWQIIRAFHMAGRCVGCGACEHACPAGIPLNVLGAAMARSSLVHFNHRSGADPNAPPLQSDFRPSDKEEFIL